MPDWTYRTLFRPVLFRYPAERARGWILRALSGLGAHPFGPRLIAWMGHTAPAPALRREVLGLSLATPVAFSADLAGNEQGLAALSRFGVGLVEVGPVALDTHQPARFARVNDSQTIRVDGVGCLPARVLIEDLRTAGRVPARVMARLAHRPGADAGAAAEERCALIALLAPHVDSFSLTPPPGAWDMWAWAAHIAQVQDTAARHDRPLFASATVDDLALAESQLESAYAVGVRGLLICNGVSQTPTREQLGLNAVFDHRTRPSDGCLATPALAGHAPAPAGRHLGPAALEPTQRLIRRLRARYGSEGVRIMAAAGATEPAQALDLLTAGADVCGLDSGLVFSGPGLPKRIIEALTAERVGRRVTEDGRRKLELLSSAFRPPSPVFPPALQGAWMWFALLGLGLIVAGLAAWGVAHTTVILPYDEAAVGLTLAQIAALNLRLPAFMTHDRVSLAGTMISIGVLYLALTWHGVRRNEHWAHTTVVCSAVVGFAGFWLWLGHGYFDPLHAAVMSLLLIFFFLGARRPVREPVHVPAADLRNDRAWRRAVWGQLGVVALGTGLIIAGFSIALVGITRVFVPEDLIFLCTTREAIAAANDRLVSLLAHDRAGFGGALISNGVANLLIGLWGIRRGAAWVWWALLIAGSIGFVAAIGVHFWVGYLDVVHLFPGFIALALFAANQWALRPYLLGLTLPERVRPTKHWVTAAPKG